MTTFFYLMESPVDGLKIYFDGYKYVVVDITRGHQVVAFDDFEDAATYCIESAPPVMCDT